VGALHELVQSDNNERGVNTMGKITNASWEGHALAFGWDGGYTKSHDARRVRDSNQPDVSLPGGTSSTPPMSRAWLFKLGRVVWSPSTIA
jgi:hypothetical protein